MKDEKKGPHKSATHSSKDTPIIARTKAQKAEAAAQQDAVIDLYNLLFSTESAALVIAESDADLLAMECFKALFNHLADSPAEIAEFNRRWIPTFNAAMHVAALMRQDRISVTRVGGHV
jgi:hypothetical protein